MKIFAGCSSVELTKQMCKILNAHPFSVLCKHFVDGEISVIVPDHNTLVDENCILLHSLSSPVNDNIMAMLLTIEALTRRQADKIIVYVPYLAYSRTRDFGLIINLLHVAGAHHCVTIDPHIHIFKSSPMTISALSTDQLFVNHISSNHVNITDYSIVAPDRGSFERCKRLHKKLGVDSDLVYIDKVRTDSICTVQAIHGDVQGKRCIIVDDIIDTGATIFSAVVALKEKGAIDIFAYCTHGVFSTECFDQLERSPIIKLIITDTIAQKNTALMSPKVEVISVAQMLADSIYNDFS